MTHCSAKKDQSLTATHEKVTPDRLYTSRRIRVFMDTCKKKGVDWAIFSDLYGIWFPTVEHEWYEKSPDSVSDEEFRELVSDFDSKLREYDEIWFYYNPSRFHALYKKLVNVSRLRDRIRLFTHVANIA